MSTGTPTPTAKVDASKDKIEITKQQLAALPEVVAVHGSPSEIPASDKPSTPPPSSVSPEMEALNQRVAEAQKALKGYDLKNGRLKSQCVAVGSQFQKVKTGSRTLDEALVVQIEQLAAAILADNEAQTIAEPIISKLKERVAGLKSEPYSSQIEAASSAIDDTTKLSWVDVKAALPALEQQVNAVELKVVADNEAQSIAEPKITKLKERLAGLKSDPHRSEIEAASSAIEITTKLPWVDVKAALPKLEQQVHAVELKVTEALATKLTEEKNRCEQNFNSAKIARDQLYSNGVQVTEANLKWYKEKLAQITKNTKEAPATIKKWKEIVSKESEFNSLSQTMATNSKALELCKPKLSEAESKVKALKKSEEERLLATYGSRKPFLEKQASITSELDLIDGRRKVIEEAPCELRKNLETIVTSVEQSNDYDTALTQLVELNKQVDAEKLSLSKRELEYAASAVRRSIEAIKTPVELAGSRLESANSKRASLLAGLDEPLTQQKIDQAKDELPRFSELLTRLVNETQWEAQARQYSLELDAIKDPENITSFATKKSRVDESRSKVQELISGELNADKISQASKALAEFKTLVSAIQGEIVREQRAAKLLEQLAGIANPEGLAENAAKQLQLTNARTAIEKQLAAPKKDDDLTSAEQAIKKFQALIETTDGELKLARAAAVLSKELTDTADPTNLALYPDLKKVLDDQRSAIQLKLQPPVSKVRVAEVEQTLLPQFKLILADTVSKIQLADRGKQVEQEIQSIEWPAGLSQDKTKFAEIQKAHAEVLQPLVKPLTEEAVKLAETRLGEFKLQLAKAASELESAFGKQSLAERVVQVKQQLDAIVDPAGLAEDATRKSTVDSARTTILDKLKEPLQDAAVLSAFKDLPAFEKLVAQVGKEIDTAAAPQVKLDFAAFEKRYQAIEPHCEEQLKKTMDVWLKDINALMTSQQNWQAIKRIALVDKLLDSCKEISALAKLAKLQESLADQKLTDPEKTDTKKEITKALGTIANVSKVDEASKKLDDCKTAFETASALVQTALNKVAKQLETADGGHSMDRHGPDITDDQLKKRVEKGIAADGVLSPTHSSTKFDEIEYWIEARDKALAKLITKANLADISAAPAVGAPTSHTIVIEHNKPIDTGFIADKSSSVENSMKDKDGNPVYELKGGKKRWVRDGAGKPLDADGNRVACDNSNPPLPLDENDNPIDADDFATVAKWKGKEPVLKVKTFTTYNTHQKVSGLTRTLTTVAWEDGKWKVVQHFPHAEGWDDVNKTYTTPLPT